MIEVIGSLSEQHTAATLLRLFFCRRRLIGIAVNIEISGGQLTFLKTCLCGTVEYAFDVQVAFG